MRILHFWMLTAFTISHFTVFAQRARDWGMPFEGQPGKYNAITDVKGVEVGYTTLVSGSGKNILGKGPIRTGVTAIFPTGKSWRPVFANWYTLNGNGEMTGTTWITGSGFLETPIIITNTNSVGVARDAVLKWFVRHNWYKNDEAPSKYFWYTYPVVAETYDGFLNDIYGFHVKEEDVYKALDSARSGPVAEGNVGGGTGMMCLGFKGGTGTSSRMIRMKDTSYTVGVLVQSNFGDKDKFTIAGVSVGKELMDTLNYEFKGAPESFRKNGQGSIIVVLATDAPLLPHQLKRLAERIPIGIGNVGGRGENSSGDIFFVFSTANEKAFSRKEVTQLQMLPNEMMDPLFDATVKATEEAIINAMVAAETMEGINGNKAYALPEKEVMAILKKYNRIAEPISVRKEIVIPEQVLRSYTGTYQLMSQTNMVVSLENGKLFIQPPGQSRTEMFAEKPDQFYLKIAPVQFRFRKNARGEVTEMVVMQQGSEQVFKKIK